MRDRVDHFPLSWPPAKVRTKSYARGRAKFRDDRASSGRLSVSRASMRVLEQLEKLGATAVVISTNLRPNSLGLPGNGAEPSDPGVAVYFKRRGNPYCLACDRWDRVADNLAAIAAEIEANRGRERWGVVSLEEAFQGFAALSAVRPWWDVLGVAPGAPTAVIKERFRELARKHHPDAGGSLDTMQELSAAYETGLAERGAGE
jgi:hypothetical protein